MSTAESPVLRGAATKEPRQGNVVMRYLKRFDDGELVRWVFRGMLLGTIGVLALDLRDLAQQNGWSEPETAGAEAPAQTILPPAVTSDTPAPSDDPRPFVKTDMASLNQPMRFELQPSGVLSAYGTIDVGASARFAAEIEARGEYVKSVSLNSPGGALDDAMAMARLVRERNIATTVDSGGLCASSCPLVLAGGITRAASAEAAVGVHQFYAATKIELGPEQAMADAQMTTARITRHLAEMGVDPALWLHALDTPPRLMYYLSPEEMTRYRLVTTASPVAQGG